MMKLALMRTATGKEDPELPLLQRISSLELRGGALLVTLIYLEFKAHLISMVTTAFSSDTPSHLFCT
jgi:hypothetical protein